MSKTPIVSNTITIVKDARTMDTTLTFVKIARKVSSIFVAAERTWKSEKRDTYHVIWFWFLSLVLAFGLQYL